MAQQEYYLQLSRQVLELLKTGMGNDPKNGGFATYWDGDPVIMQDSWLPALIVDWEVAEPQNGATGTDKWRHTLKVKVVLNKMDDAGIEDVQGGGVLMETPTKKRLERYIFARDKTTKQYLANTVMGILRKNYSMNGSQLTPQHRVEFGNSQRPGGDDTLVTSEAHVTVFASETILVSGRN